MKITIDYTDEESVRNAAAKAEDERNRLFKWMKCPEFQGEEPRKRQIAEQIQSKCRSMARIRDSLTGLADKLAIFK